MKYTDEVALKAVKAADAMSEFSNYQDEIPFALMAMSHSGQEPLTQAKAMLTCASHLFHLSGGTEGESTNLTDSIFAHAIDGARSLINLSEMASIAEHERNSEDHISVKAA